MPEIHVRRSDRKYKEVEVEEADIEEISAMITREEEERKEIPIMRSPSPIRAYVPPISFPQYCGNEVGQAVCQACGGFQEIVHKYALCRHIAQMPSYAKI